MLLTQYQVNDPKRKSALKETVYKQIEKLLNYPVDSHFLRLMTQLNRHNLKSTQTNIWNYSKCTVIMPYILYASYQYLKVTENAT